MWLNQRRRVAASSGSFHTVNGPARIQGQPAALTANDCVALSEAKHREQVIFPCGTVNASCFEIIIALQVFDLNGS